MSERISMRAVQRATEIAEGVVPLAMYLQVPPAVVAAWIRGTSEVPAGVFLRVVEIIVDYGAPHMQRVIPPSLVGIFRHRDAANS